MAHRHALRRSCRSFRFYFAQHSPTTRPSVERTAHEEDSKTRSDFDRFPGNQSKSFLSTYLFILEFVAASLQTGEETNHTILPMQAGALTLFLLAASLCAVSFAFTPISTAPATGILTLCSSQVSGRIPTKHGWRVKRREAQGRVSRIAKDGIRLAMKTKGPHPRPMFFLLWEHEKPF